MSKNYVKYEINYETDYGAVGYIKSRFIEPFKMKLTLSQWQGLVDVLGGEVYALGEEYKFVPPSDQSLWILRPRKFHVTLSNGLRTEYAFNLLNRPVPKIKNDLVEMINKLYPWEVRKVDLFGERIGVIGTLKKYKCSPTELPAAGYGTYFAEAHLYTSDIFGPDTLIKPRVESETGDIPPVLKNTWENMALPDIVPYDVCCNKKLRHRRIIYEYYATPVKSVPIEKRELPIKETSLIQNCVGSMNSQWNDGFVCITYEGESVRNI